MNDKIKIDVVSDVVCPWCAIAYKRLERAIEEMGIQDKIDLEWQPFELNPQMPSEGEDLTEHIRRKYGSSAEDLQRSKEQMVALMKDYDFDFDYYDGMRMPNTLNAHILLEYAKEKGKQHDLNMRFMRAHFSERKSLLHPDVLLQELTSIGLDAEEANNCLSDDRRKADVLEKENYWKNHGISAVPTMVFNLNSAVTGAQSVDVYKQVLSELLSQK
ncbi:DsbA family oxidoreductase [Carboxylicivirga sp. M1479]|nr:DsbA family oxidoreductase [Carboxylicivirga sp. M1479]